MKYLNSFYRDHLNMLRIKLTEDVQLFSDFIEDISTVQEIDEYIEEIDKVLNGVYEDFEIQLNATGVIIKKDVTTVEHFFSNSDENRNEMETDQFKELLLLWKAKLPERFL
ncbi:tRNA-Val4 [Niallia sp. BSM11]|uniref:tRNA-Val4 n=1 Tax=Niallia sp. BSM11 TaxID=3391576 RepID=UPI0039854179